MSDFEQARRKMVDCQIRPNDVTDFGIIDAFSAVPRELFVPQSKKAIAYIDRDVTLEVGGVDGHERYLMSVTPFAKMLQVANIDSDDVVLCIGAGSGYGAAIVAKLAGSVVAIDEDEALVDRASSTIGDLGYDNLAVIKSDLATGCAQEAPFDVILVEGCVLSVPDTLFDQLRDGGRLIAVVGSGLSSQIHIYHKTADDISLRTAANVAIPMLPGFETAEPFRF